VTDQAPTGGTPQCDRVIVVLGYSDGGRDAIHPICAARVERAGEISTAADVVVLSGWARVAGTRSEAHLMEAAWSGVAAELVVDPDARTTVGNARNALDDVRRVAANEVVVVTSRWHAARSRAAFRLLLRRHRVSVTTASPAEPFRLRPALRELPLWLLLPAQIWHARRSDSSS
jgi:uncharacterized SAM-binding protein YcdF (DUF218 family)